MEEIKIRIWNVAGMENKQENFWREIKKWDVIVLSETWIGEKGWGRIKYKLPKDYRFSWQRKEIRKEEQ